MAGCDRVQYVSQGHAEESASKGEKAVFHDECGYWHLERSETAKAQKSEG